MGVGVVVLECREVREEREKGGAPQLRREERERERQRETETEAERKKDDRHQLSV